MRKPDLTLGSDPELFFMRDGSPFPACGKLGGTKEYPRELGCGFVQEDNVMAEFNTPVVPVYTEFARDQWLEVHESMLSSLSQVASATGMEIDRIRSSYEFEGSMLDFFGYQARQFGCDPDFNAYTLDVNPTPNSESNLRTCAGHIHLGYDCTGELEDKARLVQYLDHYLGRYCVSNDPDLTRMQRYGQAGAFRPKEYGVEYRVPSNFWLRDPQVMGDVFDMAILAFEAFVAGDAIPDPAELQLEINTLGGVYG